MVTYHPAQAALVLSLVGDRSTIKGGFDPPMSRT